jgi:hypothetical protein
MLILFWLMVALTVSVWPIGYAIAQRNPHLAGRVSVKVHPKPITAIKSETSPWLGHGRLFSLA